MVLFAVTMLAGASILFEIAGFYMTCANAENTVAQATEADRGDPNDADKHMTGARSLADQLKEKNLFILKPPKQHPVNEVAGILGGEALINDKWYKAGDMVGDAKIIAVEPTLVRIVWEGQEKEFAPIGAGGPEGPAGRRPPAPPGAPSIVTSPGPRRGHPREVPPMSPEERERFRREMRQRSERRRR